VSVYVAAVVLRLEKRDIFREHTGRVIGGAAML
jgi:hypothetical protein